jgi:C1A family cysteine protease
MTERSFFGLIQDSPDARDKPFHLSVLVDSVLGSVDLTEGSLPAENQGTVGSCTCQASIAMMEALYPGTELSVLHLYWEARKMGGFSTSEDTGSQIRDAMKVLQKIGAIPDSAWPYVDQNFDDPPPEYNGERATIANYSRINSVDDGLKCLTLLHPFVLSINLPDYFTSIAGTQGVLPKPTGNVGYLGLHAMLAVGHDTNFRSNPAYLRAIDEGMDPAALDDVAFLVRNSWGTWWGLQDGNPYHQGHFWMPESWISNRSLVGDCWTGFKLFTTADAPEGPTVAGVPIQGRNV